MSDQLPFQIMVSFKLHRIPRILLSVSLAAGTAWFPLLGNAQDSATTPSVGVVKVTIAGGEIGNPSLTMMSVPLAPNLPIDFQGRSAGFLDGVNVDEYIVNDADWPDGGLAQTGTPYYLLVVDGAEAGRLLPIIDNTPTSVIVDEEGAELLNIAPGDRFRIVRGHTLDSLFGEGAPDVVGGGSGQNAQADVLRIFDGSWRSFFYNTSSGAGYWEEVGLGFLGDRGPEAVHPDSGILYERVGGPLELAITGLTPDQDREVVSNAQGVSVLGSGIPLPVKLASLNLEDMEGWRQVGQPGVSGVSDADQVQMLINSGWSSFYYSADDSAWYQVGLEFLGDRGDVIDIPAGTSMILSRQGSVPQSTLWNNSMPYLQ